MLLLFQMDVGENFQCPFFMNWIIQKFNNVCLKQKYVPTIYYKT